MIYSGAINLPNFYDINENQLLKVCRIIEKTILKGNYVLTLTLSFLILTSFLSFLKKTNSLVYL